jgi:hypothetical protein
VAANNREADRFGWFELWKIYPRESLRIMRGLRRHAVGSNLRIALKSGLADLHDVLRRAA